MDFLSLAKKRYACRKYTAQKVEQAKLDTILEAGRVAPTGANRQPQRLIVVRSEEGMARLARCTRDFGAPCAIIVCADTGQAWERKYDGKVIGDIDASIVTDHMMLCAASLGLDTLWICMFKPEAVRAEFNLPEHVEPVNILLVGYGAGIPADPGRHELLRKTAVGDGRRRTILSLRPAQKQSGRTQPGCCGNARRPSARPSSRRLPASRPP